jgi:hypothetical protein
MRGCINTAVVVPSRVCRAIPNASYFDSLPYNQYI